MPTSRLPSSKDPPRPSRSTALGVTTAATAPRALLPAEAPGLEDPSEFVKKEFAPGGVASHITAHVTYAPPVPTALLRALIGPHVLGDERLAGLPKVLDVRPRRLACVRR